MRLNYFDVNHAIGVHDEIINKSGGSHGIIDIGNLESALEHIKNDVYYPDIETKLTHLFYSINKNHCFIDGNKRSSIALSAYFLEINCLDYKVFHFIREMENVAVDVANNIINKELLFEIIYSLIYEDEFSEELKLQIIHAKMKLIN